jgi:twinkle protein
MNATDVRNLLAARAEEVCRMLLPSGKRVRHEWHAGDICGGPGDSLKVQLEGGRAGLWKDWGNDSHRGSLLDLWMLVKGVKFSQALQEAAKYLGVELLRGEENFVKKTLPEKPAMTPPPMDYIPLKVGGDAWRYLTEDRKLTPETLKAFGVCETRDGKSVAFVYRSADGKSVEMVKYLRIERPDGKKLMWSSKNTVATLYGKNLVSDTGMLAITEGEIDCMSLSQVGIDAVSVPYGAKSESKAGENPNQVWIERDFDFLERFQNLYLCFDSDEPGRKAAASLVKPLGVERCLLVKFPDETKDPNEFLCANKLDELTKLFASAKSLDPEHLKSADMLRDATRERFFPKDGIEPGVELSFSIPFRVRPGESTMWTGMNGHGKTMKLQDEIVFWMSKGQRCFVASMEIPASSTLQNMWKQATARGKPDDEVDFDRVFNWFRGKIWLYDRTGDVDFRELLSVMVYTARRYGATQFVIDSLAKLSMGMDDYDAQKSVMNDLNKFAMDFNVHVHLVAHSKKPDHADESKIPGKYDVKGSAALVDLAWNGITVWRNKRKEEALDPESPKYEKDPNERENIMNLHDAFFMCWKQRETGIEPAKRLWFDGYSKKYRDRLEDEAVGYV